MIGWTRTSYRAPIGAADEGTELGKLKLQVMIQLMRRRMSSKLQRNHFLVLLSCLDRGM